MVSMDRIDPQAPVVIAGAGQAGFSVAQKLRELGHRGPVTLVGEEPHLPYQRPPLSKAYLMGEVTADRLHLRPKEFYEEHCIDLRLGRRVAAIDRAERKVLLSDGSSLPYARLVLATGAMPRRLPAEVGGNLAGIYPVRTLADIDAVGPEFREGRHVLVVGGGYIGLEVAAAAAKRGLRVTVVEAAPRILQRVACPETSAHFRAVHLAHGVEIREATGLSSLAGDGRVRTARLTDGAELAVDFVIAGIGIVPDTSLAEAAGLAIENGIRVDSWCRTSDPFILAAGDCASFPWKGGRIRLESVGNAIDQGETVARTIAGEPHEYRPVPWFWSNQFESRLQIAGLCNGYDRVVARGDGKAPVSFWYYAGNELVAVDAINDSRAYMVARRLLEAGQSPLPEQVADPHTDLKSLLSG